ncbi:hypothetical protein CXF60_00185 [Psychrobacter sp. 4Bb]|nr:hypothetical protein CXF60_00185 [Psychrobacter sp. 4Bb]
MKKTDENNIFEFEGLQAESLKEANISKNTIIQIYKFTNLQRLYSKSRNTKATGSVFWKYTTLR